MAKLSLPRKLLKRFHPEGIPWPGTVFYNLVGSSRMFQRHYERVARDILSYCSEGHLLSPLQFFKEAQSQFVGLLCCLILKKGPAND